MPTCLCDFFEDFRFGFRILFKRPGMTFLSIGALAIAMGLTITTFAVLNALLFKPLPFQNPDSIRFVHLQSLNPNDPTAPAAISGIPANYLSDLEQSGIFAAVTGFYEGTVNLSGLLQPVRIDGCFISRNFTEALNAAVILGQPFQSNPADAPLPEILISDRLWRSHFDANPNVIGRHVRANGATHAVVGVLEPTFHFPYDADAWLPIDAQEGIGAQNDAMLLNVIARTRTNLDDPSTQSKIDALYATWINALQPSQAEARDVFRNMRLTLSDFRFYVLNTPTRFFISLTLLAVLLVLLVACANVANLLVGQALTRGREIAIRASLGASRARIIRQLLTESFILSAFGTLGGLLYAAWAVEATYETDIWKTPYWITFDLDPRVFLFAFAISILTTLIAGILPAYQASMLDLNQSLKESSFSSTSFRLGRFTRLLAISQIAFSVALLFAAGLMIRFVSNIANPDTGYRSDAILTMRMGLFPSDYPSESHRDAFFSTLERAVQQLPDVQNAAVSSWLSQFGNQRVLFQTPANEALPIADAYTFFEFISPNYFQTLPLQILQGRPFDIKDSAHSDPVAIVNQSFADLVFPNTSPIGQPIQMLFDNQGHMESFTIVGVVNDVRMSAFFQPPQREPIVYIPARQSTSHFMTLFASLNNPSADHSAVIDAIRSEIHRMDPHLPVYFVRTIHQFIDEQIRPFRMLAEYFAMIGLMSLFLATIGVYGMVSFSVLRRSREIGIRIALGASVHSVLRLVLRQGILQLCCGILFGSILALLIGHLAKQFLPSVNPLDLTILGTALLFLAAITSLALAIPAHRASRLSPLQAIRYE